MPETNSRTAQLKQIDAQQFVLSGELTMQSVPNIARESLELINRMSGDIKINLAQVVRADSAGLALLIDWLRHAQGNGFKLEFEHLPAQLLQIAKLSELHKLLPINNA